MRAKGTVGKFTRRAKSQGHSIGKQAQADLHKGGVLGEEANFARMARRHWKPLGKGGSK
jgi:hypothetical protein